MTATPSAPQSAPTASPARVKLAEAEARIVSTRQAYETARRALSTSEDQMRDAELCLAIARVEAGDVPAEFRLATPAMLWDALHRRLGIETSGAPASVKKPGPGFMRVYIGLLAYWIPSRHYWAWSDEVTAAARKEKASGK